MKKKYQLLGFDLDGTLVDSLPDLALSLNLTFEEAGFPKVSESQVMTWIGKGVDVLFDHATQSVNNGKPFTGDTINTLKKRFDYFYAQNICHSSQLYPNVKETLTYLHQQAYPLALVTNKPTKHVPAILQAMEIEHLFVEILGGHSLPKIKPHPAPLFYLCGKFGCYPEELLFVGDSNNDILAAKSAGCPSVGLTYGYNYNIPITESKPDYVFDDFSDILTIV